ncbi:hypothetical protein F0562_006401 [Nyssa sinensis]|uniref:Uncharacterized protein n=1 Tax=Nyssa sinensis TaxID=561372 RepID=A0A5J5AQ50_9ASTE|nr:hypothetical protein F0562_006401 [Nyssa sinensis]
MDLQEEDDDDIDINPFTMLLLDDQQEDGDVRLPTVDENQQLQQHCIRSIESTLLIRQIRSEGLSFQLWPAATTLFTLLDRHRCQTSTSPLAATLSSLSKCQVPRRLRILELGSGTGLVGIAAAAALGADITVTDLPHVLSNLQFNVDANADVLAQQGGTVNVAPLSWGDADHMETIGREYDLILGSDVVYHDHLYDPLIQTLRFFLLGGEKKVVFVMAHLRRWKKESAFFKMAKKLFDVEIIHTDGPSEGSRVGVRVYRFGGKRRILNAVPKSL